MPSPVKTVGIYFDLLQEQLQELAWRLNVKADEIKGIEDE